MPGRSTVRRLDWISIIFYLSLVFMGWINIYSTAFDENYPSVFNFYTLYGKQLLFFGASIVTIVIILGLEASFYERFATIFYLASIVLLLGLYPFGRTINGATAWYDLGFFNLQPAELAKMTTALALAKYLNDIQTDIKRLKDQFYAFLIILIPAALIFLQPDPGSALTFFFLAFVIFREGLPLYYLGLGTTVIVIFITTLMFGTVWLIIGIGLALALFMLLKKPSFKVPLLPIVLSYLAIILFSLSVDFVYDTVLKQHHRDRFSLWLRLEKDPRKMNEIQRTIGYNTHQSEKAIESGGFFGKGFMQGTRTKGNFVPEQHTDYIFSTVGEEWGFVGTSSVVIIFTLLLLRLAFLAERQKNPFSRMYGYGVICILFIHYFINIGMVIGILPTIGIPLPFFSYGGSGLVFFTALLFVFLKLDANRMNELG
ncbi:MULTISPECIES: rod shape-determining protein RodA [Arenibacter]|uniref:rod shape-determining protein RodA n=1 Tax=Arenibacter TaxID=178469 RepID=UPI000A3C2073|nr:MULTISPECIES: rod shape-determining protein RodA [Arenibacter]